MSLREVTYYIATCDFPGCGTDADYGDYTAMGDASAAIEMAVDADWMNNPDEGRIYCPAHPVVWDCDIEEGQEAPAPPYILIEDRSGDATLVTAKGETDDHA